MLPQQKPQNSCIKIPNSPSVMFLLCAVEATSFNISILWSSFTYVLHLLGLLVLVDTVQYNQGEERRGNDYN